MCLGLAEPECRLLQPPKPLRDLGALEEGSLDVRGWESDLSQPRMARLPPPPERPNLSEAIMLWRGWLWLHEAWRSLAQPLLAWSRGTLPSLSLPVRRLLQSAQAFQRLGHTGGGGTLAMPDLEAEVLAYNTQAVFYPILGVKKLRVISRELW